MLVKLKSVVMTLDFGKPSTQGGTKMELVNTVSMSGNLVIALIAGAILSLVAIGGVGAVKVFSSPKPPDNNEPRI